jgi:NAD(P)-dependent dehydrogenase (short-subunit alcohol dehydrogenase family)
MARGFAGAGAQVMAADILEPQVALPDQVSYRRTDVSSKKDVDALVEETCRRFGKIDIMVANAAVPGGAAAEKETEDGWGQVMAVNAKGVFLCDQAAARKMIPQGGGVIINTASVLSFLGHPTAIAYTSSKGAVLQMTRTFAIEWAKYKIRVNAIAPGFFNTPLNQGLMDSPECMKPIIAKIPLGRTAEPEEIIGTAIYLASDASRFMTGSFVVIDGGELACGGYTDAVLPFVYQTV